MGICISGMRNNFLDTTTVDATSADTHNSIPAARTSILVPPHSVYLPARPESPAARPRATLLATTQFSKLPSKLAAHPQPFTNIPKEIALEIASHLSAKDRAALSNTAHAFDETLPRARTLHKELRENISLLTYSHGRPETQIMEDSLKLLGGNLHYEDHEKLREAIECQLHTQIQELGRDQAPHIYKATIEHSLNFIKTLPTQSVHIAGALSPLLSRTNSPVHHDISRRLLKGLTDCVTLLQPADMNLAEKSSLASTLTNMNRYGLKQSNDRERAAALEHHIVLMEKLYNTNYRPQSKNINPLSSALRQARSLPPIQQSNFLSRLSDLKNWA